MFFDKEWIENLIELQKKSQELSGGVTWPKEYMDVIMQAIQNNSKNPGFFKAPDYSSEFDNLWNIGVQSAYEDIYEPKINITETPKAILVKAAIPGIKDKKEISVKIYGNIVNISGKIRKNPERKDPSISPFNRNIPLPAEVDTKKSTAKYWDGILTLYLPKATEAKAQQIEINFS
ncbi:MAG: Hsp20/alpha crystallin family protein [Tepidanaerobacteraceae bacterium]|nr:Hsp20/alpha crystallin family protein [Tepidanaerobacteraceae bacterium]